MRLVIDLPGTSLERRTVKQQLGERFAVYVLGSLMTGQLA